MGLTWKLSTTKNEAIQIMAQRYKRILTAARYYSAITNYLKYIQDETKRGVNVGKGKPRPDSQPFYTRPFGLTLNGSGVFAHIRVPIATWTKYKDSTPINTRGKITLASGEDGVRLANYRSSAAIITSGRVTSSTAAKTETSKVTGMKYLNYGGTSTTLPFGRGATANETETQAFDAVKNGITAISTNVSIRLRLEKLGS